MKSFNLAILSKTDFNDATYTLANVKRSRLLESASVLFEGTVLKDRRYSLNDILNVINSTREVKQQSPQNQQLKKSAFTVAQVIAALDVESAERIASWLDYYASKMRMKLLRIRMNDNTEQVIDEAAINQSIATILTTIPGQRVFRPQFGCALMSKLFEPMSEVVETE